MIELTLPDMTCSHCERIVTQTVLAVDPAARVEIDLPSHRLGIDSRADPAAFAAALADEGYPAAA